MHQQASDQGGGQEAEHRDAQRERHAAHDGLELEVKAAVEEDDDERYGREDAAGAAEHLGRHHLEHRPDHNAERDENENVRNIGAIEEVGQEMTQKIQHSHADDGYFDIHKLRFLCPKL